LDNSPVLVEVKRAANIFGVTLNPNPNPKAYSNFSYNPNPIPKASKQASIFICH